MVYLSSKKVIEEARKYDYSSLSNEELSDLARCMKTSNSEWIKGYDIVASAAALVKECIKRVLQISLFNVQLLAGLELYKGKIIQMNTGEGKTVSAILPVFLNYIEGKKTHILTFNDYLAKRDAEWMRPVYRELGIRVGFIQEGMGREERKDAYASDILYISAKEVGYDYLKDSLAYNTNEMLQGRLEAVIVDEADSILIDEARVPLVIAQAYEDSEENIFNAVDTVKKMEKGIHYDIDENCRNAYFTAAGEAFIEQKYGYENLFVQENIHHLIQLNNALQAVALLQRDIHYIVKDDKIGIVDEFTGRVVENRHWPDCLQAAVEAKEGLKVQSSGRIMNSTTIQNFIKLYEKVSGMTGTAEFSKGEFYSGYNLEVEVIPPNLPCIRKDQEDKVFISKTAKYATIVSEVVKWHRLERPILIGTGSVRESEIIAELLEREGISPAVLNAKNDELEAKITAEAGRLRAVTVSTNMAGRGTDIKLGGSSEEEKLKVTELGGLYIIGTTKHESRRVDFQLRGRAGRQGEPGESRFFVSLEDDIFRQYGIEKIIGNKSIQEELILNKRVLRKIKHIQKMIEAQNSEIRETLQNYNVIVDLQRKHINNKRRQALENEIGLELFREKCKEKYSIVKDLYKDTELTRLQKGITLYCIDQCWANYLDTVTYLREGIYLMAVGGHDALEVFNKLIIEAFEELTKDIEDNSVRMFDSIQVIGEELIFNESILKGPSSTWVYIVGDNPFSNDLGTMLINSKNTGFGVIAAMFNGPILLCSLIYQRFFMRNRLLK